MIFIIAVIIPWISVAARRLHDINKSGWFQAIPIPAGILETIFAESRQESLEIIFFSFVSKLIDTNFPTSLDLS